MTTEKTVNAETKASDAKAAERALFESYYPGRSEDAAAIELPVQEVTLLEDRAQVRRRGKVTLAAGRNRFRVADVAPVLQDVSLRGELKRDGKAAEVTDLRVRRAMRVRRADLPEQQRELEERIDELTRAFVDAQEDRRRAEQRYERVLEMMAKGATEIPEDAAWGLVNRQVWADTFETLSKRARALVSTSRERYFAQLDLAEEANALAEKRRALQQQDVSFCAWIEIDIETTSAGVGELELEYVVPNALWRPLHSAQLQDQQLRFQSRAAIWQNTGEDWRDVQLIFSTARSSLGTEPPLLADDFLEAQRRSEKVVVERRQVALQTSGLGREPGAAPLAASAVELPGVDDGGDVQTLRAAGKSTVLSDGRLAVVPIFEFETPVQRELVCMPELVQKVFLRTLQANSSSSPILAGPVELVRDSGVVGWTKVLFVASGERFSLSFGHDDGLRVHRTQKHESEVDPVDHWTHNDAWVHLYLSNLEGAEKRLEVVERIPISEIEHVNVALRDDCQPERPAQDENGLCRWQVTLPPQGRQTLCLAFRLSTAPDVEGM